MNVILGNSKKVIEDLRQEGVGEDKIRLIYNGINIKKFVGQKNRLLVIAKN